MTGQHPDLAGCGDHRGRRTPRLTRRCPRYNRGMQLLESWSLKHGGKTRRIELFHGDLANLPPDCREDDDALLNKACEELCRSLGQPS